MKKSLRTVLATAGLALSFGLAACGSISQNYADKINKAAATETTKDDLTYEQVKKDLGDPAIDLTASLLGVKASGACTWYKGCKTTDDFKAKNEKGKDVPCIVVTFVNGIATNATYSVVEGKK